MNRTESRSTRDTAAAGVCKTRAARSTMRFTAPFSAPLADVIAPEGGDSAQLAVRQLLTP